MENEIVIKTETIKVAELEGRDKQIFDFAFKAGRESVTPLYPKPYEVIKTISCLLLAVGVWLWLVLKTIPNL